MKRAKRVRGICVRRRCRAAPAKGEVMDKVKAIIEKLRDQAHEAESPYYTKTPSDIDWDYLAKAFREIANELEQALAAPETPASGLSVEQVINALNATSYEPGDFAPECGSHSSTWVKRFTVALNALLGAVPPVSDARREVLEKYGRHLKGCGFREWECSQPGCGETHSSPCTCGFAEVLRAGEPCPDRGKKG